MRRRDFNDYATTTAVGNDILRKPGSGYYLIFLLLLLLLSLGVFLSGIPYRERIIFYDDIGFGKHVSRVVSFAYFTRSRNGDGGDILRAS